MTLAVFAQRAGLRLTVEIIFKNGVLSEMAAAASAATAIAHQEFQGTDIAPFKLLEGMTTTTETAIKETVSFCDLSRSSIQDIYPCTPSQETYMALETAHPGSTTVQHILAVSPDLEIDTLREAWKATVQGHVALRTRIIRLSSGDVVQIVTDGGLEWVEATNLDCYLAEDVVVGMAYGRQLSRMAFIKPGETGGQCYLVWTCSHAVYDGMSIQLIMQELGRAYQDPKSISKDGATFQNLVQYIHGLDKESYSRYWRSQLANTRPGQLVNSSVDAATPLVDTLLEYSVPLQIAAARAATGATVPTLVQAAWALAISHETQAADVVFNVALSGRNAPVADLDTLAAPAITHVPLRMAIRPDQTVREFVLSLQRQIRGMVPYEHTGLQNISVLDQDSARACKAAIPLVVHPTNPYRSSLSPCPGLQHDATIMVAPKPTSFAIDCSVAEDKVEVYISFDSRLLSTDRAVMLAQRFRAVLDQICQASIDTEVRGLGGDIPESYRKTRPSLYKVDAPFKVSAGR